MGENDPLKGIPSSLDPAPQGVPPEGERISGLASCVPNDHHTCREMGKRRQARELALQVLFHMEFNFGDPDEVFQLLCECFAPPKTIRPFSRDLVLGVWANREELDRLISLSSKHWKLGRMSHVDRNILRVGVFELLFMKDIPPKVSIDEAVELGKKFGTEESGAFINGILDHVYNTMKEESSEVKEEKLPG